MTNLENIKDQYMASAAEEVKLRHREYYLCEEAIIHLEADRPREALKILQDLSERLEEYIKTP